jgi:molybdopterin synthase catalytic subunit
MRIQVLYFAFFRERLGTSEEELVLEGSPRVDDALVALASRHPLIGEMRGRFRCAVNQEMVTGEHALSDGDELALIPPVAGGAEPLPRHARILDEELSLERVVAAVSAPGCGGIVTFTGQVRDHSKGHDVVRLEYEAYAEMAEKVFVRLCDAIETELPGVRVAVEHRVGTLQVGDAAVVIAAAAAHRAEAFRACEAMIDRLKDQAPIWKKEFSSTGEEWIGLGP